MNKFISIGRLTKDIELKHTQGQKAVTNFILAVNRSFKNDKGEIDADFINCVAWDKLAENLSTFTSKGSMIGVIGRIQTRNYKDNDGKRIYVTEVLVESIEFLDTKSTNQQSQPMNNSNTNNFFTDFGNNSGITDDDLPF